MMNETQFGHRIRHILHQGTSTVRPDVAARLRAAREQALARHRPEPALAWAGNVSGGWAGLALRVLVPLAMLVAGGAALYGWQQNQRAAELEEIDALLLADELPIDAYVDRNFQNWLKKRALEE
jgi:Mn2+/Fe2+ NRAMP family transporter